MTMESIYQLTFFLALGLLAIVITIFVFAVSLLGRAMEAAAKSEKEKLAERKENNAKEMTAMKKEIEEAEASGQIPRGMIRKLKKLEKRDKKFGKELSKIRRAPELLTVKGGVLPVGSCLLGALILNGGAWYLSNGQIFSWIIPVLIWILGLAAIGYSIYGIYRCLRVIESVAITSEEVAERRLARAVKVALVELEEEKKPELALAFEGEQPPFRIEGGAQITIQFEVNLTQGDLARKPIAYFLAPPGFDFPGKNTWLQSKDRTPVAEHITTQFKWEDARKGIALLPREITVKAPSEKDKFTLRYRLTCEGFDSGYKEFNVIVE